MKAIKIFFAVLLTLILGIILTLILIWYNLDWILKPAPITYLQEKFVPELDMPWDKIEFNVTNEGATAKTLSVNSQEEFCASYLNSRFCFATLDFSVKLKPLGSPLWDIKSFKIIGQEIIIALDDFIDPNAEESEPSNIQTMVSQYKGYLVMGLERLPKDFNLDLPNVSIRSGKDTMKIAASLNPENLTVNFEQKGLDLTGKITFENSIQALEKFDGKFNVRQEDSDFLVKLDGTKLEGTNFTTKLHFAMKSKDEKSKKKSPFITVDTGIDLSLADEQSTITLKQSAIKVHGLIDIALKEPCVIELHQDAQKSIQYQCSKIAFMDYQGNGAAEKLKKSGLMPRSVSIEVEGFIDEAEMEAKEGGLLGQVTAQLHEIQQKELKLNATIGAEFISHPETIQVVPTKVDVDLVCSSFKKLVSSLQDTPLMVPAPINTLDGRIELHLSDAERSDDQVIIQGRGLTRLTGAGKQQLNIDLDNKFYFSLKPKEQKHSLDLNVLLKSAYFHLPPFDPLAGMPALTRDERIQLPEKKEETPKPKEGEEQESALNYKINIRTESNNSIRIFYKLFKPYLAFGINVQATQDSVAFQLSSGIDFIIDYMRRQVEVQKIKLSQAASAPDKLPIDVRLHYEASGYDIFIDVIGNADSPRVLLSSEPSVSREDIISLLLYNRTTSDANRFENENIGGVQSAITDRALGLFGIWAFASTPIDSVSYDSSSQVYRAQISLPGEIKFDIGTDWEKTRVVGLRKRITENWLVTTGYETTQDEGQTGNMFLQREFTF